MDWRVIKAHYSKAVAKLKTDSVLYCPWPRRLSRKADVNTAPGNSILPKTEVPFLPHPYLPDKSWYNQQDFGVQRLLRTLQIPMHY